MSRGSRWAGIGLLIALLGKGGVAGVPPAWAEGPTIQVSRGSASPGETIVVTLGGWPTTTTVTLCGNEGRRGAIDCDQTSSIGLPASPDQPKSRAMVLTVPPARCPCVLRAATADEQLIRTVPIDLLGVPTAPVTAPNDASSRLVVVATITDRRASFWDHVRSALGGATRRQLRLVVTNRGSTTLSELSLSAAIARDPQGGEPVQAPNIQPLAPGETRPYTIAVRLPAPSFGRYVIFGTVYGAGAPVGFTAATSTTPWALAVVIVLLLVDLVAMGVLRLRRHERSGASADDAQVDELAESPLPQGHAKEASRQTEVEQTPRAAFGG